MINKNTILVCLFFNLSYSIAIAQTFVQTVRGKIFDKVSRATLPGASVILFNTDFFAGTTTDTEGNFRIVNAPVGLHTIKVTFVGYNEITLPNILVNSGKESIVTIALEENISQIPEIVLEVNKVEKNKPLNDMATVSARIFSVEETSRFAAAVNDPARMAASFAGVVQTSDGTNNLSIRGNSPNGLLWRMEGVDIPNPNHFSYMASSGGAISILSTQLLTNSDFMTSAFPAEYGNALSSVFDLNLRKGNDEKREYTFQAGFMGMDAAAEGPFSKKHKASYLVNYRYSTFSFLSSIDFLTKNASTKFQDISYNFHLPTKKIGNFSLFGFGGISGHLINADQLIRGYFSNTGATGLKHIVQFNSYTNLQSAVSISVNDHSYLQREVGNTYVDFKDQYINKKLTVTTVLNHKVNARHSFRSGVYYNHYVDQLIQRGWSDNLQSIQTIIDSKGTANTFQFFSQWKYKVIEKLTFNAGLHYLRLFNNNTSSLEPRGSIKYDFNENQSVSIGYGLHSQTQSYGIYGALLYRNGVVDRFNKNIGFTKSHHLVFAYDRAISQHFHVKVETYYQYLYSIPVADDRANKFAAINIKSEDGYITDLLINKGVGRNYGLDLTAEQFLHKGLYFLFSASLYNSKYKTLDDVWRNTRYNGKYAFAFTAGKEFRFSNTSKRIFGINITSFYRGGLPITPVDYDQSIKYRRTIYVYSDPFSENAPFYFRTDLRISMKRNWAHVTTTLAIDIQNVSNRKNVSEYYFNPQTEMVATSYQYPLLPSLSYKIEF